MEKQYIIFVEIVVVEDRGISKVQMNILMHLFFDEGVVIPDTSTCPVCGNEQVLLDEERATILREGSTRRNSERMSLIRSI